MRVRLLKPNRLIVNTGEIITVSPDQARWLLTAGTAEIIGPEKKETPEKATAKTTRKK